MFQILFITSVYISLGFGLLAHNKVMREVLRFKNMNTIRILLTVFFVWQHLQPSVPIKHLYNVYK